MRGVVTWILIGMLALLSPSGSAASPAQMDATDEPVVEGPLTLTDSKCDRKVRTSERQTVAVIKRCFLFYTYDPSMESDVAADYGVVWLQSNVDGKNGWCAKRVASDILLPEGVGVESLDPKGPTEISKVRSFTTRVAATAGTSASTEGTISQDWMAYPVKIRGLLRKEDTVVRVKWTGTSAAKLGFAGGAEISWSPDSPPDGLSYQLNFALGSPDTC